MPEFGDQLRTVFDQVNPLNLDEVELTARLRRRRHRWVGGVTAAAAALTALAIALAISPGPASTKVTTRPTWPAVGSLAACRTDQLSVAVAKENPGNASQPSDYIGIHNISSDPCRLDGYPGVKALTSAKQTVAVLHQSSYEIPDPGAATITFQPATTVYFGVGWIDGNPPCLTVDLLEVTPATGDQPLDIPVTITACTAGPGRPPALDVTAIAPASSFTGGATPP